MGLILVGNDTSFGERVRIYRKDKNMTQESLAKESGISRYLISKIERDDYRPGFDKMMILASVLEMPVEHIFKGERFTHILESFYAGKTVFGKYGPQMHYGKVQMKSCMNFNTDKLFCITKENRVFMATTKINKGASGYVCITGKGVCDIVKNKEKAIGSIISDITELIVPICI